MPFSVFGYLVEPGARCLLLHCPLLLTIPVEERRVYGAKLFEDIEKGVVKTAIHNAYPFTAQGVQDAQRDLTSGKTTGKLIITLAGTNA